MPNTPTDKSPLSRDARPFALIALAAMLVMACQFIVPGYYHAFVEDALYTPSYVAQFTESFRQGIYYPRWMPLCFGGYGSPVFIFYSPLLYLMAGLLHLSGLGIPTSITLLKLLAVYAGGISMFYLVREDHTDRAALFAALFYILLPTGILEDYIINTPAGRLGQAWLPVTLLAASRLVRGPASRGNVVLMAASYAGLVLSHMATAYIFTPFIAAYGIWCGRGGTRPKGALRLAFGISAGICLSAVLFMPVIMERSLLQINLLENVKYMSDWRMPLLLTLDAPERPFENHLYNLVRYSMAVEAALVAMFLYAVKRDASFRFGHNAKVYLWLLLAALFMMSSLSGPLWRHLPGLSEINFPSRFLSVSMVFTSAILGLMLDAFTRCGARPAAITAGAVALVLLVAAYDGLLIFRSLPPVTEARAEHYFGRVDMVEYLPASASIRTLYGSKGKDPLLSIEDPFLWPKDKGPLLSSDDKFSFTISRRGYAEREFTVNTPDGAGIRVNTFWFPGWKVWVDGSETDITAEDKTGEIVIHVPPGRHGISLKFTDTPPRLWGKAVSLVTLAALIFPYGAVRKWRGVK